MESTLPNSVVALASIFLFLAILTFFSWSRALRKVQSFQTLMNDLATGKETSLLLKIMFIGSNSVFKWYYDWQLRMFGDKGMTTLLHFLGYWCLFISIMSVLGLGVFLLVQI